MANKKNKNSKQVVEQIPLDEIIAENKKDDKQVTDSKKSIQTKKNTQQKKNSQAKKNAKNNSKGTNDAKEADSSTKSNANKDLKEQNVIAETESNETKSDKKTTDSKKDTQTKKNTSQKKNSQAKKNAKNNSKGTNDAKEADSSTKSNANKDLKEQNVIAETESNETKSDKKITDSKKSTQTKKNTQQKKNSQAKKNAKNNSKGTNDAKEADSSTKSNANKDLKEQNVIAETESNETKSDKKTTDSKKGTQTKKNTSQKKNSQAKKNAKNNQSANIQKNSNKSNSSGYLNSSSDKKKSLDDAFADIENQLKDIQQNTPKKAKGKVEKRKEKVVEKSKTVNVDKDKTEISKKVNSLPSKGKLQDVKGDKIEDFIEIIEIPRKTEEIPTADANLKPLPKILTAFVPLSSDGIGEIIRKGLLDICCVLIIVSMVVLIKTTHGNNLYENKASDNFISNYATKYVVDSKTSKAPDGMLEKYYTLYKSNKDVVGWLSIPGTPIDTVVLQAKDNNKYKSEDFYGNQLSSISSFADYRCNIKQFGKTTILNVVTGQTEQNINGLDAYYSFDDSVANLQINFGTLYNDYKWKLIGCAVDDDTENVLTMAYETPNEFIKWLKENTVYDLSLLEGLSTEDKFLVLSLPYSDFETDNLNVNKTMIVVAKLIK